MGISYRSNPSRRRVWLEYLAALAITGTCTAIAFPLGDRLCLVNVVMLYLVGTTVGALRMGRGPSALSAITNMLAFNFFFVPPVLSFEVESMQYVFALIVMLIVALVIANLMISIRRHREVADARGQRTAVLYAMSRELAVASDAETMVAAASRHIYAVFHCNAAVLIADELGRLAPITPTEGFAREAARLSMRTADLQFAAQVAARPERGTKDAIYLPLHGSTIIRGVIVVTPRTGAAAMPEEQLRLLDVFAVQLALSLQRVKLAEAAESAESAKLSAERVVLCNTLLASISHDLRTPLSAIAGAGSLIAQRESALNIDRSMTLGHLIEVKARDMSQLLTNVLELMQLESGGGDLRADWHAVDDLISLAIQNHEARLSQWRITLDVPADLPLILVEPTLIVKILSNLLENITKYTPTGTTITIAAAVRGEEVILVVADDGPGLPPGDPERLFEKFQRGRSESSVVGVGLGLAICRAAAGLHGGQIRATDDPAGGARFEITLPVATQAAGTPSVGELC
jgi:two-component system sensor histidine kinase KdpD